MADERDTQVKRDELIDRLIGSGDYVELWTNKWADLLQVNRKFLGEEGAFALRRWIEQAVASNMPYDEFVRTILTASGSTLENPPAAYFKVLRTPQEVMENTTQLFLGVRFNCNQCHDHPFERWTQGQYYHLAAYFAQVGRKADPAGGGQQIGQTAVEGGTPLIEDIYDTGGGEVVHAGTGQTAEPDFPYEHSDTASQEASRREQLAHWVTSKENQYFAKSYVNRLWGYLFGRGIIEPIDDIRAGNPATNPELLDRLTQEFIDSGFDVQHMLRLICKSRTYQFSIATNHWNEDDALNYSHAVARRLPAEVLYDTILRVTGSVSHLPGVPVGYRAAQLPDVGLSLPSGFFEVFGRPPRESACECERVNTMMLGPVMTLVNGPTIADAIANPQNEIARLVATEADDSKVVGELFLRILSRPATPDEIATGIAALHASAGDLIDLKTELVEYQAKLDAGQPEWEARQAPPLWTTVEPVDLQSSMNATFTKNADHSVLVAGANARGTYTVTLDTSAKPITAIRLELLADPSLPAGGPGRAGNGNLVLSELKATVAPRPTRQRPRRWNSPAPRRTSARTAMPWQAPSTAIRRAVGPCLRSLAKTIRPSSSSKSRSSSTASHGWSSCWITSTTMRTRSASSACPSPQMPNQPGRRDCRARSLRFWPSNRTIGATTSEPGSPTTTGRVIRSGSACATPHTAPPSSSTTFD